MGVDGIQIDIPSSSYILWRKSHQEFLPRTCAFVELVLVSEVHLHCQYVPWCRLKCAVMLKLCWYHERRKINHLLWWSWLDLFWEYHKKCMIGLFPFQIYLLFYNLSAIKDTISTAVLTTIIFDVMLYNLFITLLFEY